MKNTKASNQLSAFAVTAPGLEPLCASELHGLGIRGEAEDGGVSWSGDFDSVTRANLWLRTASRVLVRVSEFKAKAFFELELHAKKIPWKRFVQPGATVQFRVTCRKSKLYHSDAVAERLARALLQAVKGVTIADAKKEEDDDAPEGERVLFVVRFFHDVATISIDSSGEALHRRGYRQQLAKAPLRETLAAAILLGAGWDGTTPLTDPMCGSGTIAIEAARLARRMAPGRDRRFAFEQWPEFDGVKWETIVNEARVKELGASPVIISGSDRDEGAIAASRANAERGGVAADITFSVRAISGLDAASAATGLVASNPPYGVRVGEREGLRNLYAQVGNVLRARRPGWRLALLSADRDLERQTRVVFAQAFSTRNGGIPVRLVVGDVPDGRNST